MAQFDKMISQVFSDEVDEQTKLKLEFQKQGLQQGPDDAIERELALSKALEAQAIANVREKRRRRE